MANQKGFFVGRFWGRQSPQTKRSMPNLIMSLPPELRVYIYELVLAGPKKIFLYPHNYGRQHYWSMPPLLRTSKQMRDDAGPVYYKMIHLIASDATTFAYNDRAFTQITSAVAVGGPQPFRKVTFNIKIPIWSRFTQLVPILDMIRRTGLEPTIERDDPNLSDKKIQPKGTRVRRGPDRSSIFSFETGERLCPLVQTSLETLVDLAKEAREEGWNEMTFRIHIENVAFEMRDRKGRLLVRDK